METLEYPSPLHSEVISATDIKMTVEGKTVNMAPVVSNNEAAKVTVPSLALDKTVCQRMDGSSPRASGSLSARMSSQSKMVFLPADSFSPRAVAPFTSADPCSPRLHPRVSFPYGSKEINADTLAYSVSGAIAKTQAMYQLRSCGQKGGQEKEEHGGEKAKSSMDKARAPGGPTNLFHVEACPHVVGCNIATHRAASRGVGSEAGGKRRVIMACVESSACPESNGSEACCASVKWMVVNSLRSWDVVVLVTLWEQEDFIRKVIDYAKEHGVLSPRRSQGSPRTGSPGSAPTGSLISSKDGPSGSPLMHPESPRYGHSLSPLHGPVDPSIASRIGRWLSNSCPALENAYTSHISNCQVDNVDVFPLVLPIASKSVLGRIGIQRSAAGEVICRAAKILECDLIIMGHNKAADGITGKGRKLLIGSAARDVCEHAPCAVVQVR
eukprot:GHVS01086087.1.p1 GENE.GHVS01086087.1~~GHVS01086087.1.p1  ORF type:complete len:440 (-),score=35.37 GHVS01086087.1:151-1470(-)